MAGPPSRGGLIAAVMSYNNGGLGTEQLPTFQLACQKGSEVRLSVKQIDKIDINWWADSCFRSVLPIAEIEHLDSKHSIRKTYKDSRIIRFMHTVTSTKR